MRTDRILVLVSPGCQAVRRCRVRTAWTEPSSCSDASQTVSLTTTPVSCSRFAEEEERQVTMTSSDLMCPVGLGLTVRKLEKVGVDMSTCSRFPVHLSPSPT